MLLQDLINLVDDNGPELTRKCAEEWLTEIGATVPEEYLQFLTACNGGALGGQVAFLAKNDEGEGADFDVHHVGGLRDDHGGAMNLREWMERDHLPKDGGRHLCIMGDSGGSDILMTVVGAEMGAISYRPPFGRTRAVCSSFSVFVEQLHPDAQATVSG